MYRSKDDFWQMIAFAAIFSRLTPAQAAAAADGMLDEYEKRRAAGKFREDEGGRDAAQS